METNMRGITWIFKCGGFGDICHGDTQNIGIYWFSRKSMKEWMIVDFMYLGHISVRKNNYCSILQSWDNSLESD